MSPPAQPELSIIVPAYNEEQRLPAALGKIGVYLARKGVTAEVVMVDDGSTDRTAAVVEQWRDRLPGLRLLSNGRNRGKGYSVRQGMLQARGRVALFTDADLSAPIEEADKLLAVLGGCDAAIGSRAADRSLIEVHQSRLRELAGTCFNLAVRAITGVNFQDTQCGFKAFVRDRALIVFQQQRAERFGFDAEILFLAQRHGLRVVEIPVRWAHHPDTKVHMLRDSMGMLAELLAIRWHWLLGRYPRRRQA